MRKNINLNIYKLIGAIFFCASGIIFTSCRNEEELKQTNEPSVKFLGIIGNENPVSSRALIFDNLTFQDYPFPLYVRMDVTGMNYFTGVYTVKSGYEGRLTSLEGNEDLNWQDLNSGHTFWSWTMPWKEDTSIESEDAEIIHLDPSYYSSDNRVSTLTNEDYINCSFLEKFIGTRKGPVIYNENGEYVELQYYHLVSKIVIAGINLITNDGTSYQDVVGEMTIFNLPKNGYFFRHGIESVDHPYIDPKSLKEGEDYGDITYSVSKGKALYIHPEVKIDDLKFKIKLNSPLEFGETGEYYGDLSSVSLRRGTGEEWDTERQNSHVLFANEVINLSLTLSQGNITGVSAYISNWDNKDVGTSNNYPHKGIYTGDQANDLFNSNNSLDDLYELYGEEDGGEKIFHLYEDINLDSLDNLSVQNGYIFDGMGHTITVKDLKEPPSNFPNVRDVYITDGTTTIYIDSDGIVHTI